MSRRRTFSSQLEHLSPTARRQIERAEREAAQFVGKDVMTAAEAREKYSGDHPAAVSRPQPAPGRMNKTEAAYAQHLELQRLAGELLWYRFEAIKLRLATKTFYTPDFAVISRDGVVQLHEVKGHWEDDARVKIKVAAEMYPFFRFLAVQKRRQRDGGGWKVETF